MKLRWLLAYLLLLPLAALADVGKKTQQETIDSLFAQMRAQYVFPDKADEAERLIRKNAAGSVYDGITDGKAFADRLTADLRSVCHDAHLHVRYSRDSLPSRKSATRQSADEERHDKWITKLRNAEFEKVERLPGNVGYIKFNGFVPADLAAAKIQASMEFVKDTDALIFDLRTNGGGEPDTVRLICSYLFGPEPRHLNDIYTRPTDSTEQFWTLSKVSGPRYLDRDVYVLIGKRTGSAAEEMAYDLKNLHRATLIGESTWGGANPGEVVRLNDHFAAFIPTGRAINPVTKTNWEGDGVQPDIHVPEADSLHQAHVLAVKRLVAGCKNAELKHMLEQTLVRIDN